MSRGNFRKIENLTSKSNHTLKPAIKGLSGVGERAEQKEPIQTD